MKPYQETMLAAIGAAEEVRRASLRLLFDAEVQRGLEYTRLLENGRPSVVQIAEAWLGGRITAEEAMTAIVLHPLVVPELVRCCPSLYGVSGPLSRG